MPLEERPRHLTLSVMVKTTVYDQAGF